MWFDAFENARRRQAVLAILEREQPDVIALEEVPNLPRPLLETPWIQAGYRVSRTALDAGSAYEW